MAGDALNEADQQVRAGKRSTLAAMAQHGSQGVADLAASQRAVGDAQAQAMAQLTAGAQGRNAPAAAMGQLTDIASQPYTAAQTYLGSAQASYGADAARLQQAHGNYMDEAAAAIPVIRADADAKIGLARTEWERRKELEELQQQMAQEKHQWALEEHEAQMRAAAGEGGFLDLPQYLQEAYGMGAAAAGPDTTALDQEIAAVNARIQESRPRPEGLQPGPGGTRPGGFRRTEDGGVWMSPEVREYEERRDDPDVRGLAKEKHALEEKRRKLTEDYDPESPEAMAAAYQSLGVDPVLAQGLALSQQPDATEQVSETAALFDARAQAEGFRNYEDMQSALSGGEDRPEGILRADEAAQFAGIDDPKLLQDITASTAYADAIATVEDYLNEDEAVPWAEVEGVIKEAYPKHGRTLALVREMYADKFR